MCLILEYITIGRTSTSEANGMSAQAMTPLHGLKSMAHPHLDKISTRTRVQVNVNLIKNVEKPVSVCKQEIEFLVPSSNG